MFIMIVSVSQQIFAIFSGDRGPWDVGDEQTLRVFIKKDSISNFSDSVHDSMFSQIYPAAAGSLSKNYV